MYNPVLVSIVKAPVLSQATTVGSILENNPYVTPTPLASFALVICASAMSAVTIIPSVISELVNGLFAGFLPINGIYSPMN